jgi:transcription elongation factor Elf1
MTGLVRPCPKCKEEKIMTKHHIYPIRFFGKKDNTKRFLLCRECHDCLERHIPLHQIMPKEFYPAVIEMFLNMEEPK